MTVTETALIVIDVQESFRHRPYFSEEGLPEFAARLQRLVNGARAQGIPVAQIFHVEETGPFAESSGFVTTLSPLDIAPDAIFHKRRHSALVGTGLDIWLTKRGIRRLIICGIRTEQCCETTTRHASDLGYAVNFVAEATLTFPIMDPAGRLWSVAEITERTELVLARRFARIATVEEALAAAASAIAA